MGGEGWGSSAAASGADWSRGLETACRRWSAAGARSTATGWIGALAEAGCSWWSGLGTGTRWAPGLASQGSSQVETACPGRTDGALTVARAISCLRGHGNHGSTHPTGRPSSPPELRIRQGGARLGHHASDGRGHAPVSCFLAGDSPAVQQIAAARRHQRQLDRPQLRPGPAPALSASPAHFP